MKYLRNKDWRVLLSVYFSLVVFGLVYPFINSNNSNAPFDGAGTLFNPVFAVLGISGASIIYTLLLSIFIDIATTSCKPLSYSQSYGGWGFCGDNSLKYDIIWLGIYIILLASIFLALPYFQRLLMRLTSRINNKKKAVTSKRGSKRL